MFRKLLILILSIFVILISVACSSGGSSSGASNDEETTTVTGTVAVTQDLLSLDDSNSFFNIKSAFAAVTGLEPLTGGTVELIEVNDSGEQVGDVIASASISSTGNYSLNVPSGVNLAANLMIRVMVGTTTLRSFAVETTVNVNPATEFLIQKVVESGTHITSLEANEVIRLQGYIEDFDFTGTASYDAVRTMLEEQLGEALDNAIASVNSVGDASLFAGDYNTLYFALGFMTWYEDNNSNRMPFYEHEADIGSLTLEATGDNTLSVTSSQSNDFYSTILYDSSNYYIHSDYEIESNNSEDINTAVTALDDNTLFIETPFSEELIDSDTSNGKGFRWAANNFKFQCVNNNSFGVSQTSSAALIYDLTDGVIADDATPHGKENTFEYNFVGKKLTGATKALLNGNYGVVNFTSSFNNSSTLHFQFQTILSICSLTGDGDDACSKDDTMVTRVSGTTFIYDNVSSDGSFTGSFDGMEGAGFIADNGNFFVMTNIDNSSTESLAGLTLGVKVPSGNLELDGKTYNFYYLGLGSEESMQLEVTRFKNATVTFYSTNGTAKVTISDLFRYEDSSAHEFFVDDEEEFSPAYTLSALGKIEFTVNTSTETITFEGYGSEDSKFIVLKQTVQRGLYETATGLAILIQQ